MPIWILAPLFASVIVIEYRPAVLIVKEAPFDAESAYVMSDPVLIEVVVYRRILVFVEPKPLPPYSQTSELFPTVTFAVSVRQYPADANVPFPENVPF